MTIKFGLLGAGRIGKVHAKAVTGDTQARLVAVADAMPAAAQAIADQNGCEVRTIEAICAAKDIDAVVICTPTDTHADLIEAFVKAGKAVFCEKPIDLSLAHGDLIPIEERGWDEVAKVGSEQIAPDNVPVYNPAFDVTPARLVSAIVTETGVVEPGDGTGVVFAPVSPAGRGAAG